MKIFYFVLIAEALGRVKIGRKPLNIHKNFKSQLSEGICEKENRRLW